MVNWITDFFNLITSNITLIIILALVGFILFLIITRKREKEYKKLELPKEIKKDVVTILDNVGENDFKKRLSYGLKTLGIIKRGIVYNWRKIPESMEKDEFVNQDDDLLNKEIYIFEVVKEDLITKIKSKFLDVSNIYYIDKDLVIEDAKYIRIDNKANPVSFLNTIVFSKHSKNLVEDIAFKISRQQELEEIINFLPKQTFLEVSQSRTIEQFKQLSELEKAKRKDAIEELTGGKK